MNIVTIPFGPVGSPALKPNANALTISASQLIKDTPCPVGVVNTASASCSARSCVGVHNGAESIKMNSKTQIAINAVSYTHLTLPTKA
jgi:hypothetical protein